MVERMPDDDIQALARRSVTATSVALGPQRTLAKQNSNMTMQIPNLCMHVSPKVVTIRPARGTRAAGFISLKCVYAKRFTKLPCTLSTHEQTSIFVP